MTNAQTVVAVQLFPDGERRPISPWIYGVNHYDDQAVAHDYPLVRWGGNHTTRYSWDYDVSNRANDWYFINIPYDHPNPSTLPSGSTVERLADQVLCDGNEILLTVPTIGWTPRDRNRRWGFSVAKYGLQQQTAPGDPDAGNGVRRDGSFITGNDPNDTSRAVDSSYTVSWLEHLAGRYGMPSAGGVRLYALDNEPMHWHQTHRDVHPQPVTYDEIWSRTVEYASAIKAFDPGAKILGPVVWGWCAYWGSAADQASPDGGCGWGPDRLAHDDIPFLLWYLQQVCAYEAQHGVRLIDYLDVHYYPAAWNVALSSDESTDTADRRLRSVRSLHDPDYVDESWIDQSINLIPMLRGIVSENCPGLGVAITEYNWGNDEGASSALAQAEVLAVFGREGVDLATRWMVPKPNTPVEDAFLLYLDYDGMGSQLFGDSVPATSEDVLNVPVYAIAGDHGRLYTLLFNKSWDAVTAVVTSSTPLTGQVEVHGFDAWTRLGPRPSVEVESDGTFTLDLPARSVTLAVAGDGTVVPPLDYSDGPSDLCGFGDADAGGQPDEGDLGPDLVEEVDLQADRDGGDGDQTAEEDPDPGWPDAEEDRDPTSPDLPEAPERSEPDRPSDDGGGCSAAHGAGHQPPRPFSWGLWLLVGAALRRRLLP